MAVHDSIMYVANSVLYIPLAGFELVGDILQETSQLYGVFLEYICTEVCKTCIWSQGVEEPSH